MRWSNLGLVAFALALRCDTTSPDTRGVIPPEPAAGPTSSQTVSTFAIQTILVGDAFPGCRCNGNAWKAFGYDLDGLLTTETSTNVCMLAPGAPDINQIDGDDGIDNAWGSVVLMLIQDAASIYGPSQTETSLIGSGAWTLQLQVTGLTADPTQTALGLDAQVFVSGQLDATPAFDQTTDWPVLPSSLVDGATIAGGALVHFSNVYVTNGTLVAEGASQPIVVPFVLPVGDGANIMVASLPLRIHGATLTFVHSAPNTATQGIIAGVLDTQELIPALHAAAAVINSAQCGAGFDGLAQQFEQAQDILQDGANASGVPCDGISIGLGFTAALVANPTQVGVDPPPQPDPCDAGSD